MFRKELCVPRLLCHPCIPCQKWVPVLRCRNLKHRVHRRLLPGDYTEYLKVQRFHRTLFATTRQLVYTYNLSTQSNHNFNFWIAHGRQLPWILMFRKELCVPRLLCHPCILCQKWVSVLRCRNLKHRVHRRLLTGDYTEYLKVQRIHRKAPPSPPNQRSLTEGK